MGTYTTDVTTTIWQLSETLTIYMETVGFLFVLFISISQSSPFLLLLIITIATIIITTIFIFA